MEVELKVGSNGRKEVMKGWWRYQRWRKSVAGSGIRDGESEGKGDGGVVG